MQTSTHIAYLSVLLILLGFTLSIIELGDKHPLVKGLACSAPLYSASLPICESSSCSAMDAITQFASQHDVRFEIRMAHSFIEREDAKGVVRDFSRFHSEIPLTLTADPDTPEGALFLIHRLGDLPC